MAAFRRPTRALLERCFGVMVVFAFASISLAGGPTDLRVGGAFHAFDHLGAFSHQADAALASGATVIYATGLGGDGYSGLPPPEVFAARKAAEAAYSREAKAKGIQLVLGYLCATSIVGLKSFDANWTPEMRARFRSPTSEWRQQGRDGKALASWYGGEYEPACMSHPDWREYEKFMVRAQIEAGHDGIFFDNPTVHPRGCYCSHCMARFATFLEGEGAAIADRSVEALRAMADQRSRDFLRFRATIGRDFLAEMRAYARTLKPDALVTANNSVNSPGVLYSQSRSYGYNILELSRAEDLVVVEDMTSQPRTLSSGATVEYGPTYKQLHALRHGKPLVAVTIAEGDYHTPPNLVRLAFAEAAACEASYLVWTTWPEAVRPRLAAAARIQIDLLRRHQDLLSGGVPRTEALLFLPFRRWVETETCAASGIAASLVRENVQFDVFCEEDFTPERLRAARVLVLEDLAVLSDREREIAKGREVVEARGADWLKRLRAAVGQPAVMLSARGGAARLRAYARDFPGRTVVHVLNLDVRRLSSFEDEVSPAEELEMFVRVPLEDIASVECFTADAGTPSGPRAFTTEKAERGLRLKVRLPRLEVAAMVVVTGKGGGP